LIASSKFPVVSATLKPWPEILMLEGAQCRGVALSCYQQSKLLSWHILSHAKPRCCLAGTTLTVACNDTVDLATAADDTVFNFMLYFDLFCLNDLFRHRRKHHDMLSSSFFRPDDFLWHTLAHSRGFFRNISGWWMHQTVQSKNKLRQHITFFHTQSVICDGWSGLQASHSVAMWAVASVAWLAACLPSQAPISTSFSNLTSSKVTDRQHCCP